MKKLLVPTLCVLAGCAAGAMIPAVTAQWPDNPQAQRWQQECVNTWEGVYNRNAITHVNTELQSRGAAGWELVANDGAVVCFKRPAP